MIHNYVFNRVLHQFTPSVYVVIDVYICVCALGYLFHIILFLINVALYYISLCYVMLFIHVIPFSSFID